MKKEYEVIFVKSIYLPIRVEAEDENEAQDIANSLLDERDFDLPEFYGIDVSDVEEVKAVEEA